MGAPKQKWRSDEEAALKAGVVKHGAGKWRTILKDPEFSDILHSRSNVDLKVYFLLLKSYKFFLHPSLLPLIFISCIFYSFYLYLLIL